MPTPGLFKIRLTLTPETSGGFVVTSPDVPELLTEGDTVEEALANVRDAVDAARELYADLGKPRPPSTSVSPVGGPVEFETLIEAA